MSKADELYELQQQMLETLAEMQELISDTPAQSRAEAYWIPHIKMALTKNHGFLGGSMVDCDDTINELDKREDDEDEYDEDE